MSKQTTKITSIMPKNQFKSITTIFKETALEKINYGKETDKHNRKIIKDSKYKFTKVSKLLNSIFTTQQSAKIKIIITNRTQYLHFLINSKKISQVFPLQHNQYHHLPYCLNLYCHQSLFRELILIISKQMYPIKVFNLVHIVKRKEKQLKTQQEKLMKNLLMIKLQASRPISLVLWEFLKSLLSPHSFSKKNKAFHLAPPFQYPLPHLFLKLLSLHLQLDLYLLHPSHNNLRLPHPLFPQPLRLLSATQINIILQ